MMYANQLAAAIKVNGKVLREFKDTVYIPYNAEYAILIKNLHTQRAVVNVYIDGDNVVLNGLVLNGGEEITLERSIKNGNLNEGNRFKFIERTNAIEQHRGIKLEDGLVRIEYQFEQYVKPSYPPVWWENTLYKGQHSTTTWNNTGYNPKASKGILRGGMDVQCNSMNVSGSMSDSLIGSAQSYCETGITVPGSKSEQKFQKTYVGVLEVEKHSMVIRLLGDLGHNKPVLEPVTVKTKQKCVTCGHTNKATAHFCNKCGTALKIYA